MDEQLLTFQGFSVYKVITEPLRVKNLELVTVYKVND
jgi:hypothetical protein